jgi:hypothetical protein
VALRIYHRHSLNLNASTAGLCGSFGPPYVCFTLGKAACLNPWAFPKIGVYYMRPRRSAGGPA